MEGLLVEKLRVVSVKIPEEVYEEMLLRVPEGDRADFLRDAILEKLQKTPKADRVLALEGRVGVMEKEFSEIKKHLSDLELLTYDRGSVDPHEFSSDELDRKIISYLVHYRGGTTPELAEYVKTNRWQVLNRLRRIEQASKKKLGKPIIEFYAGEKSGKKKAWWISEELTEA